MGWSAQGPYAWVLFAKLEASWWAFGPKLVPKSINAAKRINLSHTARAFLG